MGRIKRTQIENMAMANLRWSKNVRRMTEATLNTKKVMIFNFIRGTGITDSKQIDHNVFNRWISRELNPKIGGKSPNTVITQCGYVLGWLRWAKEMGYPVKLKFPMVSQPAPEPIRRRHYTREDIERVLGSSDSLMNRVVIMIGFDTGLRSTEIYNIRLRDIDGRTIRTVGKGRKLAFVRITEETKRELDKWITFSGAKDYLWIKMTRREYHKRFSKSGLILRLRSDFEKAGFPNFQMHELRHSFATDLRRRGAPLDVVQKMMRHANLQVTERYLHNLDGGVDEVWDYFRDPELKTEKITERGEILALAY